MTQLLFSLIDFPLRKVGQGLKIEKRENYREHHRLPIGQIEFQVHFSPICFSVGHPDIRPAMATQQTLCLKYIIINSSLNTKVKFQKLVVTATAGCLDAFNLLSKNICLLTATLQLATLKWHYVQWNRLMADLREVEQVPGGGKVAKISDSVPTVAAQL